MKKCAEKLKKKKKVLPSPKGYKTVSKGNIPSAYFGSPSPPCKWLMGKVNVGNTNGRVGK